MKSDELARERRPRASAVTGDDRRASPHASRYKHHIMYYWYRNDDVIGKGAYGMVRRAYDVRDCAWYRAASQPSLDDSASDSSDSFSLHNSDLTKSYVLSNSRLQDDDLLTTQTSSPSPTERPGNEVHIPVADLRERFDNEKGTSVHDAPSRRTHRRLGSRHTARAGPHRSASTGSTVSHDTRSFAGAKVVALKTIHSRPKDGGLTQATLREIMVLQETSRRTTADEHAPLHPFCGSRGAERRFSTPGLAPATSLVSLSLFPPNSLVDSCVLSMRESANLCGITPGNTATNDDNVTVGKSEADEFNHELSVFGADRTTSQLELHHPDPLSEAIAMGQGHIIRLHDVIVDTANACVHIALEYCDGGDLAHFMRRLPGRRLEDATVYRRWMRELVQALAFLHARHLSHRDIKPQNVMLQRRTSGTDSSAPDDYILKLGDFGLSRVEDIAVKKYVHEVVTLWYRSPDVLLGNNNFAYSVDAWSLGCIMLEVATGAPPFSGTDEMDQLQRIFRRLGTPTAESFPSAAHYARSARFDAVLHPGTRLDESGHGRRTAEQGVEPDAHEETSRMRHRRVPSERPETRGVAHVNPTASARSRGTASGEAPARPRVSGRRGVHSAIRRTTHALRTYLAPRRGLDVLGDDGLDLVARLLQYEPERRLSMRDALRHRFFAQSGPTSASRARRTSLVSQTRRGTDLAAPCAALTTFLASSTYTGADRGDETWELDRAEGSLVTAGGKADPLNRRHSLATTHMPLLSFPEWQHGEAAGQPSDASRENTTCGSSEQVVSRGETQRGPGRRAAAFAPAPQESTREKPTLVAAGAQPRRESSGSGGLVLHKPVSALEPTSLHAMRHALGDTLAAVPAELKSTLPPIKHTRRMSAPHKLP